MIIRIIEFFVYRLFGLFSEMSFDIIYIIITKNCKSVHVTIRTHASNNDLGVGLVDT